MKNRKGIKIFIAFGLIAVLACLAWLYNDWNTEKQEKLRMEIAGNVGQMISEHAEEAVPDLHPHILAMHVVSHRGFPAAAEEHTITGYDLAVEAGTRLLEQDLVISADGTLYISHDLSAYRMTGTDRNFASMTDAEIDKLRTYGGDKILKLSEVFERYGKNVCYVIELKDGSDSTIKSLSETLEKYDMTSNVILQCFYSDVLAVLDEMYPDIPKMYLCKTQQGLNSGLGMEYADIISVRKNFMSEANLKAVHDSGKKFSVWTIDSEYEIKQAIELGVDMYFTNDTGLAFKLEEKYR